MTTGGYKPRPIAMTQDRYELLLSRFAGNAIANMMITIDPKAAPPTDAEALATLRQLVVDLQQHSREAGWQDVDDPIAALLAYPLPAPPVTEAKP